MKSIINEICVFKNTDQHFPKLYVAFVNKAIMVKEIGETVFTLYIRRYYVIIYYILLTLKILIHEFFYECSVNV